MIDSDLLPRGQVALALLIAEEFQRCPDLTIQDRDAVMCGIALAWKWVEGHDVDSYDLCEYIDGEINLPIISTEYVKGSQARDLMVSAFHSIGIAAFYACMEADVKPSEGVENFGQNEWQLLLQRLEKLDANTQQRIANFKKYLLSESEKATSGWKDITISRASIIGSINPQ